MPIGARQNGLRFLITKDYETLSRRAAKIIRSELERDPRLLLCASAGGTPTGAYRGLARIYARQPGLFARLRVVQIDEWTGLERTNPASCEDDLRVKLLGPMGIGPKRFRGLRSDSSDPAGECRRMESWLSREGPIDLCILGLGTNGHIAMNEPGPGAVAQAHVARLAESSRHHALLRSLAKKPRFGMTLGLGQILRSRKILLLVSGPAKRAALELLARPRVTTRFPASFLWLHPDATILCDRAAAKGTILGPG